MHIAILTFDGFNELDSLIALGILNRIKSPGWRVSLAAPSATVTSMNGVMAGPNAGAYGASKAGVAGMMHDLGKAAMPMSVLNKPGKLTEAEFSIIKTHPEEGYRLLQNGGGADPVVMDVCLHHHEKMDGSGYPHGLKGDEISLFAKMGAVCDVYDAITSNRPYKAGWDPAESLRKMAEWASGHFDGKVFQAFVKSLGIYPIGSLVRLSSGRLGVVVEQTAKSLTTPCVKVFYSTKSQMRILPEVVDLSRPGTTEKIVSREEPAKWKFADLDELWSGTSGNY